jgi:hypothetical protein
MGEVRVMEIKANENDAGDLLCRRAERRSRPLWVRVVISALLALTVVLTLCVLYLVWFVTGKAHVTVDYALLVEQMSQAPVAQAENAWSCYEKAFDGYVGPDDDVRQAMGTVLDGVKSRLTSAALAPERERAIQHWVRDNEEAWQLFLAGSRRRYCQPPHEVIPADHPGKPWLCQFRATGLNSLRHFADLGLWRSRLASREGKLPAALQECLVLARAGVHWQQRPTQVEYLAGCALSRAAHQQILQILADPSLSAADLSWLQKELTEVYAAGFPLLRLQADRFYLLDTVQHVFTKGGPGGGHVIPRELARLVKMIGGNVGDWGPPPKGRLQYLLLSMAHIRRDAFLAKANELYDQADVLMQKAPYQCRQVGICSLEKTIESLDRRKYALVWWICPAAERVSEMAFAAKALHEGTLLVLALRRWHLERGGYPPELRMLVEGQYLRELPLDPFGDGPPVYRLTQDGFLLYSLGLNFTDEGGNAGLNKAGRAQLFARGGDLVFWPPAYVP